MKCIVAGSREINDYELIRKAIKDSGFNITELVSGHARGVDQLGEKWAKENNIPIKLFLPDWSFGKSAGYKRNYEMSLYGEALIAITNGSKGTANMIEIAKKKNLKIFVVEI